MKLRAATDIAQSVDQIALALTWVTGILVAVVVLLILFFSVKYRKGSKADRSNRVYNSWLIEISNSSLLLIVGLVFFLWSAKVFYREFSAPKNSLELYVIGKQWLWMFQYPGGPEEIGHIKVPINRPVRILLSSSDVIHSFFVPDFRLKQDAVPGRYTSLWFEAKELGKFTVLCTEYCGTSHSRMRATIEVISQTEFDQYLQGNHSPIVAGAAIYRRLACATCHETGGKLAPLLGGVFGSEVELTQGGPMKADENYIRRAIFDPAKQIVKGYGALMPTYRGQLSDDELAALVEYIKGLPGKREIHE